MAVLIDERTRLVVQGVTGKEGTFHTLRNRSYGTNVVAGVTPGLKRRLGKLAYVVRGLGEWWRGGHARCRVSIDGASRDALWVVVSNTRRYGGRFVLAATADIESAEFTVTVFAAGSRLDLVRYLGALARGRVGQCRGVSVHHATKIELHGNAALQINAESRRNDPGPAVTGSADASRRP